MLFVSHLNTMKKKPVVTNISTVTIPSASTSASTSAPSNSVVGGTTVTAATSADDSTVHKKVESENPDSGAGAK